MIPPALTRIVLLALAEAGERSPITRIEPVKGGMVSKSWRIVTRRRSYLLKYHENPAPYLYSNERRGLELLKAAGARVPTVIACADKTEDSPGYCIQEWIHPGSPEVQRRRLGPQLAEEIARLHRADPGTAMYGSDYSHTDGPIEHGFTDDWAGYVRDRFLLRYIDRLVKDGRMPSERREALERLEQKLPDLLGDADRRPSLLHGDLHMRNVLANRDGDPVLIDPTAFYGDRELETAYMHLWGFFPPLFWQAYESAYPHADGYAERRDVYLICHILGRIASASAEFTQRLDAMVHRFVGYGRK